ncbi:uncharacterized protein LOC127724248 [Mytilus californianus]|uniref:uncharacterized protein LOC127724248 n=1 Tax=Mytilus californianus TaxID=6549 RepID=UPI002247DDB9|nr:uncharacterized protein LOC127724248 [Mytilus californianus]XP_052087138.1 uncharacterized protein LOC127724248 [Mytilus californianus]
MENISVAVQKADFYNLESFDKYKWLVFIQAAFFAYILSFISSMNFSIVRSVWGKPKLQNQANILLCVLLIIETLFYAQFTITSTGMMLSGKIWLNRTTCKLYLFFVLGTMFLPHILLTLAAIEKFTYIVFPFKYERIFSLEKTIMYLILCFIFIIIFLIITCVTADDISFSPTYLACFLDRHDMNTAAALYGVITMINAVFQVGMFSFTITKMKISKHLKLADHHMYTRLWKNALNLFTMTILNISSCVLFLVFFNIDVPSIFRRISCIYIKSVMPFADTLIILLGNKSIRKSIMFRNKIRTV